jgi:DNA-binding transcriptional MerR regulator
MLWLVGGLVIVGVGYIATYAEKRKLIHAMQRDGFTPAEIKRAMCHHSRDETAKMTAYCREVFERKALVDKPERNDGRDWTRADAYKGETV